MQLFTTHFSTSAYLLALVALVTMGGCSKKPDDPIPVATTGMSWTADNTNYVATNSSVTDDGFIVKLFGKCAANGSNFAIDLEVPAAVGTYSIPAATYTAYYFMSYYISSGGNSVIYAASNAGGTGTGTVTITTFSATDVAGTFSLTGATASGGQKAVTNGKFSLKR